MVTVRPSFSLGSKFFIDREKARPFDGRNIKNKL